MSSYFYLELDTTKPIIQVNMPDYTLSGVDIPIIIESDSLVYMAEIYFIDSEGNRHNVVLTINNDELYGSVNIGSFSNGIATLYTQVFDDVLNGSDIIEKEILITNGSTITIEIDEISYNHHIIEKEYELVLYEYIYNIRTLEKIYDILNSESVYRIILKEDIVSS